MELLEFGHGGATVIVYPTSQGRYYEWEDRGMIRTLSHAINAGWFHVICVDSVDAESWYCRWKHPGARAWRQEQYENYVLDEVLPMAKHNNPHPYTITTGASFGAYHALDLGLRHPHRVNRILSMSGMTDIRMFTDGIWDDTIYRHNPVEYIPNEQDSWRLHYLRQQNIILVAGTGDRLIHQNRELSGALWNKGIGNALREWDGFSHDWPVWHNMVNLYLGGHD